MSIDDSEFRHSIEIAVHAAFKNNPVNMSDIIDALIVHLKPIVKNAKLMYTISELKELLM